MNEYTNRQMNKQMDESIIDVLSLSTRMTINLYSLFTAVSSVSENMAHSINTPAE